VPSETFFRLPEEKRQRLMDAAWEEFTTVRFSDASINKIIRSANIPRGSFYQYFTDKDDLFSYLVRPLQQHFFELARQEVLAAGGSMQIAPLAIYDRFFNSDEETSQDLNRCIQIVRCNPESEFHTLFCGPDSMLRSFTALVDIDQLSSQEPDFLQEVFHLFVFTIASAIIDTLNHPDRRDTIRRQLALRVDILLRGCMPPISKEVVHETL